MASALSTNLLPDQKLSSFFLFQILKVKNLCHVQYALLVASVKFGMEWFNHIQIIILALK